MIKKSATNHRGHSAIIAEPVSIFTHQLKKPLAVARSYLEVVLSGDLGELNDKQKEYLRDTLENINRMTGALTMLFDVSRIDEHQYRLTIKPTDIVMLVERAIAGLSFWANKWNTLITLHTPDTLPRVLADQERTKDVVENFISNAVKYRPLGEKGRVDIRLEQKGNFVMISCADNGMGVSSRDGKKIFTKFFRSEEAVRIEPVGTGLGLYINQAVVTLSGGKIWFKTNPGGGTIFYFTLPIYKQRGRGKRSAH